MKLLICGDFVPNNRTKSIIETRQNEILFESIKDIIKSADYSMVNLEAPIVVGKSKGIKKAGPNLHANPLIIESIKYLGFDTVTLANNHFYDYGEKGVMDTIDLLKKNCIKYVGGGENLYEASNTLYERIGDTQLAIINCCEHEYSIATSKKAGSNPIDIIQQYYKIKEAKSKECFIIVIVHGGVEGYQLPTPRMKELYQFFIDCGADVIINHHQHCYSGYEEYKGKLIFYGLGNFCFDWKGKRNDIWNEGYMLELQIKDHKRIEYKLIPYIQGNETPGIELMNSEQQHLFFERIDELNSIIRSDMKLAENYKAFMNATRREQKGCISPYKNRYLRAMHSRGWLPNFLPYKSLRSLENKIMCESHRERFLDFLEQELKNKS